MDQEVRTLLLLFFGVMCVMIVVVALLADANPASIQGKTEAPIPEPFARLGGSGGWSIEFSLRC